MQLRETSKEKILNFFDETPLGRTAFEAIFSPEGTATSPQTFIVRITFIGNDNLFFEFGHRSTASRDYKYYIKSSPGLVLQEESERYLSDVGEIFDEVKNWCTRLVNDLKHISPLYNYTSNEIKKLKEEFDKKIEEVFGNETGYFDYSEVQNLKQQIDKLYENLEKLKEENLITNTELEAIKKEFEKIKESSTIVPKSTWYKTSGKKIVTVIAKYLNPDTVSKLGTEVVKGLIEHHK